MEGKTLLCAGFGSTKPSGAGAGRARKAWLAFVNRYSTRRLRLQQNAEGRFMYYGDSGGPCFDTFSSPGGGGAVLASILSWFYTTSQGVNYDIEMSVARDAPWSSWLTNTAGF